MANSKANIYPIQLQNAELNLNKYNAEIKQYSGFNKNNAPFVGGCLSNIFTKDEHIEGANGENVYIAENGDVYQVTNEGLFKNDEKVLDVDPTKLYDIEEVQTLNNYDVVSCFDDWCFCYKVKTETSFNYSFRYYDFNLNEWKEEFLIQYPFENFISFDCKRILKSEGYYIWLCGYEYANTTSTLSLFSNLRYRYQVLVSVKENENTITGKYTSSEITQAFQDWSANQSFYLILHGVYNATSDKLFVIVFPNSLGNYQSCDFFTKYNITISVNESVSFTVTSQSIKNTINNHDLFSFDDGINDTTLRRGTLLGGDVGNNDVQSYYVIQNKFYLSNYYQNNVFNTHYVQQCDYKIVAYENDIQIQLTNPIFHVPLSTDLYTSESRFEVVFNTFGLLAACLKTVVTSKTLGYCDYKTNAVSVNERKRPHLNIGCVLNDIVLMNNELVSGLTLPDTKSILVSDWNTIEKKDLFLSNYDKTNYNIRNAAIVFYKTNNKFYKLVKTNKVLLKYINNLLVVNCDIYNNCYDITTKEKKLFAPSWNNRAPFAQNYSYSITNVSGVENKYYFASTINEYNLQGNASLILNPVPIVNKIDFVAYGEFLNSAITKETTDYINLFIGTTEVKYLVSLLRNDLTVAFRVDELMGLPFPTNTDGNVMYSPSLFSQIKAEYGNNLFIKNNNTYYPLMVGNNNDPVMSFYLASGIDNLDVGFIVQGQFYGIINNGIYSLSYSNGVVSDISFVVDCTGLQFCGSTPYEALFFSPTNRCLYSFVGSNVLNPKQFVDKISQITMYKYNPSTQSIFLVTDIGVIVTSLFGIYQIDMLGVSQIYLLNNGVVLADDNGNYRYIKYYSNDTEGYSKNNVQVETCFYGQNNQLVTINDCLYMRLYSEEHEAGEIKVSATTLSNEGRKTETTTFKIKSSDWDKMTHTIYLRYQPKEQRGLGVSFNIDSPFKIASMSIGSVADAILVDKVSKGAISAPYNNNSSITEW